MAIDENLLPVEYIHVRIRYFRVNQQGETFSLHSLEHRVERFDSGHAGIGIRGGARRVELDAMNHATAFGLLNLIGRQPIGHIKGHQGCEATVFREGLDNPLAIGLGHLRIGDRWLEVGHDDRATEALGGVSNYGGKRLVIPQVEVPVIGSGQGNLHRSECRLVFLEISIQKVFVIENYKLLNLVNTNILHLESYAVPAFSRKSETTF